MKTSENENPYRPAPSPSILLLRPRNPLNIGAVARAMANFGFEDLRICEIHESVRKDIRNNPPVSAVGAEHILEKAKFYSSLEESLEDRDFTLGTSCMKNRKSGVLPIVPARGLNAFLFENGSERPAIMFGPEKTGLKNTELSYCDALINIPTVFRRPSMNLAQAAAIILYELSAPKTERTAKPVRADKKAGREELMKLHSLICAKLGERRNLPTKEADKLRQKLLSAGLSSYLAAAFKKAL